MGKVKVRHRDGRIYNRVTFSWGDMWGMVNPRSFLTLLILSIAPTQCYDVGEDQCTVYEYRNIEGEQYYRCYD